MSKEKAIEIKINDVTYIVSEINRNDDHLKQIIKDMSYYLAYLFLLYFDFRSTNHIKT